MKHIAILFFVLLGAQPGWAQTEVQDSVTQDSDVQASNATTPGSPERFSLCQEPGSWGTSADYLRRTARCAYGDSPTPQDARRIAIIEDIFIKSWSYAVLNKIFFWISIGLAMLVLIWPALGAIFKNDPPKDDGDDQDQPPPSRIQKALSAASVQTSVTALAVFSFAFYAHYKDQQAVSETLMRKVLYVQSVDQALVDQVVERMSSMDRGFGFSGASQGLSKQK